MTTEKKNGYYLKAIGLLLSSLIAMALYIWDGTVKRLDSIEEKVSILESRSEKGQWTDSLIISNLADIKEEMKK